MNKTKKYVWYPSNEDIFRVENICDSIEECIAIAKERYANHSDEYDKTENNSTIITIGEVETFNLHSILKSIFEDFDEILYDYVDEFALHTDTETECYITDEQRSLFAEKASEAMLPLVKEYVYCFPIMKAYTVLRYDLKKQEEV